MRIDPPALFHFALQTSLHQVGIASLTREEDGLVATTTTGRTLGPVDCLLWAVGRQPHTTSLAFPGNMDQTGNIVVVSNRAIVEKFIYSLHPYLKN